MRGISIGEAARLSGVHVNTIRYYEERGLLPVALRTEGNRRQFDDASIQRLRFVRHARTLGFDLTAITELLALQGQPEVSCGAADSIARKQLLDVEARIERLQALRAELFRMTTECDGGRVEKCRVIESLADHGHCRTDHGPNLRHQNRLNGSY